MHVLIQPAPWVAIVSGLGVMLFLAIGLALTAWLFLRNYLVRRYRLRCLETIEAANARDIKAWATRDYDHALTDAVNARIRQRLDAFEDVPYDEMMWHFWRPLKRFYDPSQFTRPAFPEDGHV